MNPVKAIGQIIEGRSAKAATIQTFLSRILILLVNVGTGVITARYLGAQGRGEQAAMIMWPQFLAYTMTLGIPSALIYNLKLYPQEKSNIFAASLVLGSVLGCLATLTGIIFIPSWLSQYSSEVISIAQWLMLFAPLALLGVIFSAALESENEFALANQFRYLSPLVTLMMLSILVGSHKLTPINASLAYMIPSIPLFFWLLFELWENFQPNWQNLGLSSQKLINYGLRSYGVDLLGTLSWQLDQVLVVNLLSPSAMGIYVVALSISRMLDVFQSSITTVLLPQVAARPTKEIVTLTEQAARVNTLLTFLASLSLISIAPLLLPLLYGSEFQQVIPILGVLLIEVTISGTVRVLAQAFMASGQPGTVTILQGIGLSLSVPLMFLLIPRYGLVGASFALLGSTMARLVFILLSYPLILKSSFPSLLIQREDYHLFQEILLKKREL